MASEGSSSTYARDDTDFIACIEPLCLEIGAEDSRDLEIQLHPKFLHSKSCAGGVVRLIVAFGERVVGDLPDACVNPDGSIRMRLEGLQHLPAGILDVLMLSAKADDGGDNRPAEQQVIAAASLPILPAASAHEMSLLFDDMMLAADSSASPLLQQESALHDSSLLDSPAARMIRYTSKYKSSLQQYAIQHNKLSNHQLPEAPWLVDPARAAVWAHHYQPLLADLRLALGPGILSSGDQQLDIAEGALSTSTEGSSAAAESADALLLLLCRSEVLNRLLDYFTQNAMPSCVTLMQGIPAVGRVADFDQPDASSAAPTSNSIHTLSSSQTSELAPSGSCQASNSSAWPRPSEVAAQVMQTLFGFTDPKMEAEFVHFQNSRSVSYDIVVSALILIFALSICFRCCMAAGRPMGACKPVLVYWSAELVPYAMLSACPLLFRRHREQVHISVALTSAGIMLAMLLGVLRLPPEMVREQLGGWVNILFFGMLYPSMKQVRFSRLAWAVTLLVCCKWWLLGTVLPHLPAARSLLLAAYATSLALALLVDMQARAAFTGRPLGWGPSRIAQGHNRKEQ